MSDFRTQVNRAAGVRRAGAGIPAAVQRVRQEAETRESLQGRDYIVQGHLEVTGPGEVAYPTNFPQPFVERPLVFGGGEMKEGQELVDDDFPTWSVGVAKWYRQQIGEINAYVGCQLIIVITGPDDLQSIAHWQVTGPALRAPFTGPS